MAPKKTDKTPKTLRVGTFNVLRDRRDKIVRGNIEAILRDHNLHALAWQEGRDYIDMLPRIKGYDNYTKMKPRGANQNGWLVREDIKVNYPRAVSLGGDGWTTVSGHHHVGCVAMGITLAGWCRCLSVHLPPSIDWKKGKPVGPKERVDDYIDNMKTLVAYAKKREDAEQGLLYVGDWNCRPGRDEGYASVTWMAKQAGMKVYQARNTSGGLRGIDFPVATRMRVSKVTQQERYGSDHPLVTFTVTRMG